MGVVQMLGSRLSRDQLEPGMVSSARRVPSPVPGHQPNRSAPVSVFRRYTEFTIDVENILYFVGAGLTKALQKPGVPIPVMKDFVSAMADYLDDDVVLTALAHYDIVEPSPYEWQPPGIRELAFPLGDGSDRSPARRAAYRRALKNRPSENVEMLLQKALQDPKSCTAEVVPVRFNLGINQVFRIIDWNLNFLPLSRFLARQFESTGNRVHTFVSFNYDLVLDYAVLNASPASLSLELFYGLQSGGLGAPGMVTPRVIKPHGSLNFIVPIKVPYEHTARGLALDNGPGRNSAYRRGRYLLLVWRGRVERAIHRSSFPAKRARGSASP